jgi:hypothetical protein
MDPNFDGLMAIFVTSICSPERCRLLYVIINREVSVEHLLRACPLLGHLRARIPGKVRQNFINDLSCISIAIYGNLPCLEVPLSFMPKSLPKSRTDLRPIIERTKRPEWRRLPPVEIPVSSPLKAVNQPHEPAWDEEVRLCDQAFRIFEEQVMEYTDKNLTFEMAAQLRKGWPLEDDSHWDLSISQLLYNRINPL